MRIKLVSTLSLGGTRLTLCSMASVLCSLVLIGGLSPFVAASEGGDYGLGKKQPIPRNVYWGDTHLHTSFLPTPR